MAKNYYAILDVPRTATREEIEAAYRKMSQLYHPDVNGEAFAANIYQRVTEAWRVLADEERRRVYDAQILSEVVPSPQAAPARSEEPSEGAEDASFVSAPGVPPHAPLSSASQVDQRAFYAARLIAEKKAAFTFQDWLSRKEVAIVIAGSILLIDVLVWLFGLRLSGGETPGFLFRSSSLVFLGWAGYLGLRYYTAGVFFCLGYSLFYAVIYAVFLVRIYFNPALYAEGAVSTQIVRQISVHFVIFYALFFCAAQSLEEGGLKTLYDRATGRK